MATLKRMASIILLRKENEKNYKLVLVIMDINNTGSF